MALNSPKELICLLKCDQFIPFTPVDCGSLIIKFWIICRKNRWTKICCRFTLSLFDFVYFPWVSSIDCKSFISPILGTIVCQTLQCIMGPGWWRFSSCLQRIHQMMRDTSGDREIWGPKKTVAVEDLDRRWVILLRLSEDFSQNQIFFHPQSSPW